MSIPQVTFADPERSIIDYLAAAVTEPVGSFYPKSSADAPVVPFVQVALDGTPDVDYPITERATVRVTCWATKPTDSKVLASTVQSVLLTHPGDDDVYAVHALTGRLPTRDPATGYYLTSFTSRVSMRPTAVV